MKTKGRNELLDIVKCIGIMLIVLGHAGIPFLKIRQLFNLPVFFIASGYLYRYDGSSSFVNFLKRKIKGLYFPCVMSTIILLIATNILISMHIYSDETMRLSFSGLVKGIAKALLFSGGGQLLGANWFFRTLFIAIVLYELIHRACDVLIKDEFKRKMVCSVICFVALVVGWIADIYISNSKSLNFLCVMSLLDIGQLFKRYNFLEKINELRREKKIIIFIGSLTILIIMRFFDSISITSNYLVNPVFFLTCSFVGFLMCYMLADFINCNSVVKAFFCYAGKNSIVIMLLHFIVFKIVTFIQIQIYELPI